MPDERTIIERTRARYERDGRIPHPQEIAVSEKAGAVTVRGTVATPHQRQAAIHIARSVPGVTFVSDELVVDPRDHTADAELRGAALQAVMVNPELADHIDVTVHDGWLTLKGEVKHQTDSDAAFDAVSGLPGIGGITNAVKVVTAGLP